MRYTKFGRDVDTELEFLKHSVMDFLYRHSDVIEDEFHEAILTEFYGVTVEDALAELYPKNLRVERGEKALVVDVRGAGLPDFDYIVPILSRRLGVSEDRVGKVLGLHGREVDEIFWDTVVWIVESLSKEIGYPVYQYGRMAGYWGIPVEKIELVLDVPKRVIVQLRDRFIKDKVDEITEYVMESDDPKVYLEGPQFEIYLRDVASMWISNLIRDKVVDVLEFIKFKDDLPRRFIQKVKDTVKKWDNQELWADVYEDYVRKWLAE